MLEKRSLSYADGPIPVPIDDLLLQENVQRIHVCDTGMCYLYMNPHFYFLNQMERSVLAFSHFLTSDEYLVDEWVQNHDVLLFWQVKPVVHVFQVKIVM